MKKNISLVLSRLLLTLLITLPLALSAATATPQQDTEQSADISAFGPRKAYKTIQSAFSLRGSNISALEEAFYRTYEPVFYEEPIRLSQFHADIKSFNQLCLETPELKEVHREGFAEFNGYWLAHKPPVMKAEPWSWKKRAAVGGGIAALILVLASLLHKQQRGQYFPDKVHESVGTLTAPVHKGIAGVRQHYADRREALAYLDEAKQYARDNALANDPEAPGLQQQLETASAQYRNAFSRVPGFNNAIIAAAKRNKIERLKTALLNTSMQRTAAEQQRAAELAQRDAEQRQAAAAEQQRAAAELAQRDAEQRQAAAEEQQRAAEERRQRDKARREATLVAIEARLKEEAEDSDAPAPVPTASVSESAPQDSQADKRERERKIRLATLEARRKRQAEEADVPRPTPAPPSPSPAPPTAQPEPVINTDFSSWHVFIDKSADLVELNTTIGNLIENSDVENSDVGELAVQILELLNNQQPHMRLTQLQEALVANCETIVVRHQKLWLINYANQESAALKTKLQHRPTAAALTDTLRKIAQFQRLQKKLKLAEEKTETAEAQKQAAGHGGMEADRALRAVQDADYEVAALKDTMKALGNPIEELRSQANLLEDITTQLDKYEYFLSTQFNHPAS